MSNDHNSVEKIFKPGMKIKEAIQQTGKRNSDVSIVHASTKQCIKDDPSGTV